LVPVYARPRLQLRAPLAAAVHHRPRRGGPLPPQRPVRGGQPAEVRHRPGGVQHRDGWRVHKPRGGIVMELPGGEVVTRGLSMPPPPRWHDGRLWVLESGTGGVVHIDAATGRQETVAGLPGFTRGLAMVGPYAFVGLSKIRPTSSMDGVPLAERRGELRC